MSPATAIKTETAVLGGGCFWCLEAVYQQVSGISSITAGFAGGTTPAPTYEQVCAGTTGHAEVIQLQFNPSQVSYQQILKLFWQAHDPTTYNRQGADEGSQYRSMIFYQDEEQHQMAVQSKTDAQQTFCNPIVTEIVFLKTFYPAEECHQQYFKKNPTQPYCRAVIQPKLQKLQKENVLSQES